jgi:hypothetical protein
MQLQLNHVEIGGFKKECKVLFNEVETATDFRPRLLRFVPSAAIIFDRPCLFTHLTICINIRAPGR